MFDSIAEKIVKRLTVAEVIEECDGEIYLFGMQQFLSTAFGFISVFLIMLVMGEVLNGILFVVSFSVLRQYAGGYHASTKIGCYIMSLSSAFVILLIIKYFDFDSVVCLVLLTIFGTIILLLSPVEAVNKPLDQTERSVYRKRTIITALIEFIAAVALVGFGYIKPALSVVFAYGLVVFALVMGNFSLQYERSFGKR